MRWTIHKAPSAWVTVLCACVLPWCPEALTISSQGAAPAVSSSPVQVQVEKTLVGVNPIEAKEAWLSYQWKHGGGLPILVVPGIDQKRMLLPIGMQEQLLVSAHDKKHQLIRYKVTDMGLLGSELENDSHVAEVTFVPSDSSPSGVPSTSMIWNVDFEAKQRPALWETVTKANIQMAATNLASHVAVPRLYRRTMRLPKVDDVGNKWVDFVWKKGGGLPIPPPLLLNEEQRLQLPPGLLERLVFAGHDEIRYTVDNPGLFTYQVHSHVGRVRFTPIKDSDEIELVWEVAVRPFAGWSWLVERFTSMIVTILARNFKSHVTEPGAMVKVAPPRGKGEAFGEISKDTWLGGVLAAHLSDQRSTVAQTFAIFQPWTWGRSTDDAGEGQEWKTDYMSD